MKKKLISLLLALILILWLLGTALPTVAGEDASDEAVLDLPAIELPVKGNPKLDSQLNQLILAEARGEASSFARQRNIQLVANEVRAVIECEPGYLDAAMETVVALGGRVETSYQDLLQVVVPVAQLTALADTPGIRFVRLPWYPVPTVVSEGVSLISANEWHTSNFTGAGVKVAILDSGFTGYAALLGTELPASVTTQSFYAGSNIEGYTAHGTACAEIVYDIAPDAQFYLVNSGTDVELGNAVNWLIEQDVDIISYSVGWFIGGPGDGTGPITQVVDAARAAGILWVSAMGNHAQRHWQGNFVNTDGDQYHEFSQSPFDETNTITVSSGNIITALLKWDDTWGSSGNDYDLLLFNNAGSLVALSNNIQDGNDYPIEGFSYTATYTGTYNIAIGKLGSPAVINFHLYSSYQNLEYQVASSSFAVPADSPNAMAVGAIPWNTPTTIEPFSSQGPTKDGRIKPDLVAPDGVTTATYSPGPFYGTSASAPHAAGAAALVKNRYPLYTPAQIQDFLEGRAVELGAAGKDNLFGSGRLNLGSVPTIAIYVPDNYSTIQAAVNAAISGDTIIVRDGTYTENIDVNTANLTIQSQNGANTTIVQAANPNDHVFEVTADYVEISGFTVKGATGADGKAGIYLYFTEHGKISNNNAIANFLGMNLNYSSNNTISSNTASNNGHHGIVLSPSSHHNIVTTNTASNNTESGIVFWFSSNNTARDNASLGNGYFGIHLHSSSNNSIEGNHVLSNGVVGILLKDSSSNSVISNTVSNSANATGIQLHSSLNNKITSNTVNFNGNGIGLENGSEYNAIISNIVSWNIYQGMYLRDSSNNHIVNSTASNNIFSGIRFWSSSNNTIYLSNFSNNTNVYSENSTNTWNSPQEITYTYNGTAYTNYLGNYWSDYGGADNNSDGIGDTPYSIDADNDSYPLMQPFENYAAVTTDLALKAGWNLVSLPVDPGVTDPNMILKDVGWYSIYTWDATGKRYEKPGAEGMVVGKGYWVMVLNNVTQSITGVPVQSFTFDAPATGWYMIGSLYSQATFAANPSANAYTKVYEWDATNKRYTAPLTTIAPGMGNWFLALGPCSVSVSPYSP